MVQLSTNDEHYVLVVFSELCDLLLMLSHISHEVGFIVFIIRSLVLNQWFIDCELGVGSSLDLIVFIFSITFLCHLSLGSLKFLRDNTCYHKVANHCH